MSVSSVSSERERGQTVAEFSFIIVILLMMTMGLIDVGRAFYEFNAVATAARDAARYGAISGGYCSNILRPPTAADWCTGGGAVTAGVASPPAPPANCAAIPSDATYTAFWRSNGNYPCEPVSSLPWPTGTLCPQSYDSSYPYYYTVSDFAGAAWPSIAGMVAKRFTTNVNGTTASGGLTAGFNQSQLKVCIQAAPDPSNPDQWRVAPGAPLTVFVYYPFQAVTPVLRYGQSLVAPNFSLVASSQYFQE